MSTELTLGLGLVSTSEMCGTKVGLFQAIHHESEISTTATKPEIQVVGWPPVRLQRKKEVVIKKSWSKYVKLAVDGVPYLRKVDLEMYTSYDHLLSALPHLFTMCNFLNEGKLMDPTINVVEYLPTYEDNDGDWMLLGDVPWKLKSWIIMSTDVHSNGNGHSQNAPFKIFIGYDPREDVAYEVCRYSLLKRSSIPLEIIPIKQSELREKGLYWRERGKLESTEFSFSRFLTPHLANFEGWAMFVDCDFLYLGDIKELRDMVDDKYALMCVQHDYAPKETTKMDGAVQTVYPRKNWSSMVLYNCGHPKNRVLTPEIVNTESGAFLHRFTWLEDEEIGEVPFVWNFLVGHNKVVEGDPATFPKSIHYTLGGPWFEAWKDCEFGDLWMNELEEYKKATEKKLD